MLLLYLSVYQQVLYLSVYQQGKPEEVEPFMFRFSMVRRELNKKMH